MNGVSGATPNRLEIGDQAPDFSLPSAQGGMVDLEALVAGGPVFLWFAAGMV